MLTQKQNKTCEKKWLDTKIIVLKNENTEGNNYLCCLVCSWIWSNPEPSVARKQTSSCLVPAWCGLPSSGAPWGAAGGVVVVVAVQVVVETVAKAAEWNNHLCCSWIWSNPEPSAARKRKNSCLAPAWCRLPSSGAPWGAAGGVGVVVAVQVVVETVAKAAEWNNHLCCSWNWWNPEPSAARKQTISCLAPTLCELSSLGDPWGAAGGVGVVVALQVVVETVAQAAAWNNYLCCSWIWSNPEPSAARKQTSSCLVPAWCRLPSPWGAAGGVVVVVAGQVVVETVAKAAEWNNHLCCSWIWSNPELSAARKQTSSCLAPTWCDFSSSGDPWGALRGVGVVVAVQVVVETVAKAAACMVGEATATVGGRSSVSSMPVVCSWPHQWKD